ncbi:MAG: endolytic transglycosylase MltG [Candidatus Paceibacterota bacterium]
MRFWKHWLVVLVVAVVCLALGSLLLRAPMSFSPTTLTIAKGDSAALVAGRLSDARVIVSSLSLRVVLRVSGGDNKLREGTYAFNYPENVFSVARRILSADYGVPAVRVTFVEGITVREMAVQVAALFPSISEKEFIAVAKPYEGYLFPDTYVFSGSMDARGIVDTLRANFDTRTEDLRSQVPGSRRSFADVVVMASLIEKEARTEESRRMVSGILWNRIDKDMRLQVDAVFGYIFNRPTYNPSQADQKTDSPYNTYLNKGLPPGAIGNPGLSALSAAANPAKTNYLYYLTGDDNLMHYATTFAGHIANQHKYLQ